MARLTHPRRAIPRRDGGSPRNNNFGRRAMDVPRGGRGRLAPRGRHRLAVRQSMVRIAAAATPPTPTSSTTARADHGAARGDYRRYRHPVASRLRCRSRIVGLAVSRKRGFTYCEEVHRRRRARLRVWGLPRSPVASFPPGHGLRAHGRRC
jgi:hypothetical protein